MPGALIIQVPRGGSVDRQLSQELPPSLSGTDVVIERLEPDDEGALDAPHGGEVVLSYPAPESLSREADEVRRVIARAGGGVEPLIVVIEAAEEFLDEELAPVLAATEHVTRPVILRVIRNA